MLLDLVLLAVAMIVAMALALRPGVLNHAWLLLPLDAQKPLPNHPDTPVLWRFTTYRALRDPTAWKPKAFLTLTVFLPVATLLKLLVNGDASWVLFYSLCVLLSGIVVWVAGSWLSLVFMNLLLFVPGIALAYATEAYGIDLDPSYYGLTAGILLGSYAGVQISLNWRTLAYRSRLEFQRGEDLTGAPLTRWSRFTRGIELWWIRLVPWMVAYELVAFWWEAIDLGSATEDWMVGFTAGRYAITALSLGIGLNFVLVAISLFSEVLERNNVDTASEFSGAVVEFWRRLGEGDEEGAREEVEDYLGKKGEWRSFQKEQMFWLVPVLFTLILTGVGEFVDKALNAGWVQNIELLSDWTLADLGAWTEGYAFCTNVMFLVAFAAASKINEDDPEDPALLTMQTIWKVARNPELTVTCAEEEDSGGDPVVRIYGEAAAS